nr:hypothetical protein [Acinetobacter baumannii]
MYKLQVNYVQVNTRLFCGVIATKLAMQNSINYWQNLKLIQTMVNTN